MAHPDIPSFFYRLFKWICRPEVFDELQGDLEEAFESNIDQFGPKKARAIYRKEVLQMMRLSVIKGMNFFSPSSAQSALLKNFTLVALRNIKRHKTFSFINVFGLSVAMSVALVIIAMVFDLLKFDEFHARKDHIYRVISERDYPGYSYNELATSPRPLGKKLMEEIPGIQLCQLRKGLYGRAKTNNRGLIVKGIYADKHFFDFFSFEMEKGNPATALEKPFTILISQNFKKKFFKNKDAVGEIIEIDGLGNFLITGIVKDPPKFSHIQFEAIASLSTIETIYQQRKETNPEDNWVNFDRNYNYFYTESAATIETVENWLAEQSKLQYTSEDDPNVNFALQKITSILPGKDLSDQIGPKMMMLPILILSGIAMAILLAAISNYTNLSIARALKRAKEVGVRKVIGAKRSAVFWQFTIESMIISILSLGFALFIFSFIRDGFQQLVPRASEVTEMVLSPGLVVLFIIFSLITGLIAGIFPALFFSKILPIHALGNGSASKVLSKMNFKKGLIVGQFALAIMFIMAVVITNKQYTFSLNHEMGFDRDNILILELQGNNHQLLVNELSTLPEVQQISKSSSLMGSGSNAIGMIVHPDTNDSSYVYQMYVDETFVPMHQIKMIAGRYFTDAENSHKASTIMVNERFTKAFGFETPMDAINKTYQMDGNLVTISGVVADFHYSNLEDEIKSFVFRNVNQFNYLNLKIQSTDITATFDKMDAIWQSVDEYNPLQVRFLDDHIEFYYSFLKDIIKLFSFVGFVVISISCLGLFGMVLFNTESRLKEIGIRKTFGASIRQLIFLLAKNYLKLISIATIIGMPICYLLFDRLILEEHYYRMQISVVEILTSIGIISLLAMLSVGAQTFSAARSNPVECLRNE